MIKYLCGIIALILIFPTGNSHSQTSQIYAAAGYSYPTTSAMIGHIQNFPNKEVVSSGFSEGLNFQAGYSYSLTDNFLLDFSLEYLAGVSGEQYDYSVTRLIISENETVEVISSRSFSNSNFSLSPAFVIITRFANLYPYIKFGGSINFISITDIWKNPPTTAIFPGTSDRIVKHSYNGNFIFGWLGGIGFNYYLSPFSLFVELQLSSITFYPDNTKDEIDPYKNSNDYDVLRDFPFSSLNVLLGIRLDTSVL